MTASVTEGAIQGGSGKDQLILAGSGVGQLGVTKEFESIQVDGGNWTLSGAQSLENLTGFGSLHVDSISLLNGSTLAIGALADSVGNLELFSNVSLAGTTYLDFFDNGDQDGLSIHGLLTLLDSSIFQLNFNGSNFVDGQIFNVLRVTDIVGLDYSTFFTQINDSLNVKSHLTEANVPEPGSLGLMLVSLMALVGMRKRIC
ncbi:PEP-CTERM sorting domain-containing protein [Cellvibrio mixtus]|uniref:PEP-CTERM sorting domain-containing protein n=1 Tax=Cellvibrio mixtus TaxID=39650 RepID=UPI001362E3E5|nr:PEP-CTERM sorting domain-containing protein [Cellvibrio mixtus]